MANGSAHALSDIDDRLYLAPIQSELGCTSSYPIKSFRIKNYRQERWLAVFIMGETVKYSNKPTFKLQVSAG